MTTPGIADHIVFALLAFVLPMIVIWRGKSAPPVIPQDSAFKIRLYWINGLLLWIGALTIVVLWLLYDRSFIALGFRMPAASAFPHWMLIVACFILFYYIDGVVSWSFEEDHPAMGILPTNWREFAHFGGFVSISAGVCEELVFRGFMITYLLAILSGQPYVEVAAVLISSIVFGIAHAYQGWQGLIKVTLLSMLFGWLYVLTGSLLVVIVLHFAINFSSGLFAVLKSRTKAPAPTPGGL